MNRLLIVNTVLGSVMGVCCSQVARHSDPLACVIYVTFIAAIINSMIPPRS